MASSLHDLELSARSRKTKTKSIFHIGVEVIAAVYVGCSLPPPPHTSRHMLPQFYHADTDVQLMPALHHSFCAPAARYR
jgi:hypothetical protein